MKRAMRRIMDGKYGPLLRAVMVSNLISLLLFLMRVAGAESFRFGFLFWNLLLGAVPLLFAGWLTRNLRRSRWLSWQNILLTGLWLAFLPNSFYILTDLIHVRVTGEINILFDVVLFTSCIFNSFTFGFISLYLVHRELLRRIVREQAQLIIGSTLLICSFAIYLGRYLRWNSWDIVVHPFGVLFDVSNRIINPADYPQTVTTTFTFFLLLSGMYMVIYEFARLHQRD